jgi:hypothetical protein
LDSSYMNKSEFKRTCTICYENEIKVLLKPCNHLCVCSNCSKKIDNCPMCRENIFAKEEVNFS